jgi:hypothetical protein
MDCRDIAAAAGRHGLLLRGGFHCLAGDSIPDLPGERPAATLVLLGNAGSSLWAAFSSGPERLDGAPDPLDRWSARVIGALATQLGAAAIFPFGGPPYHPFQRWALRAEPVAPSPIGMLIHPVYGLWHAYRGALAFAETLTLPPRDEAPAPCESCREKPCLSSCPVDAFGASGYGVGDCVNHIVTQAGQDCMTLSCRARRACPVGREYLYQAEQAGFHMEAFLSARLKQKD